MKILKLIGISFLAIFLFIIVLMIVLRLTGFDLRSIAERNNIRENISEMREGKNDPDPVDNNTSGEVVSGLYSDSLVHDGITRNYLLHLPQGYSTNQSYPLVLLLHGGQGTAEAFIDQSEIRAKADADGFIVVAPNAVDKNWNDKRGGTSNIGDLDALTKIDDVGFLETLVGVLAEQYAVDTNRVYSTGISNGGFMSQRLACETNGLLAAIAPVASPMIPGMVDSCPQPDRVAVLGIQGTDDPFFPIPDNDGIPEMPRLLARSGVPQTVMTVDEILEFWPAVNNCSTNATQREIPDRVGDGTTIDVYEFNSCSYGNSVVYYIIEGAGHSWPPANPALSSRLVEMNGGVSSNIVANEVIWNFFSRHSL